ncbi:MAG: hypothetical protein JW763_10335 [candidate division Zixibacteria bacterium]|nr:hypothetical protein [candidate division Zixibacteria bacterium]
MRLQPRVLRCCRRTGDRKDITAFLAKVHSPDYDILEISGNTTLEAVLLEVHQTHANAAVIDSTEEYTIDDVIARLEGRKPLRKLRLVLSKPKEESVPETTNRWDTGIVNFTAATLSHEINNPLMTIAANAEMLLGEKKNLDTDIRDKISIIASEARRIQDVTRQLTDLQSLQYRETATGKMIVLPETASRGNRIRQALLTKGDNKSLDKHTDNNILAKR